MRRAYLGSVAENKGAHHDVAELSYVSGPAVPEEQGGGLRAKNRRSPRGMLGEKVLSEQGDVIATAA